MTDTLPVPDAPLLPARRVEIATSIQDAIRSRFAHWQGVPSLDLTQAHRAYLDEALAATGRLGFDLATLRFVASFRNGHTAFGDDWLWREHGAPLGFDADRRDDGWRVKRSAVPDLPAGSRILRIARQSADRFAVEQMAFVSGSSERERLGRLFSRPFLFPSAFEIETQGGRVHRIERGTALPVLPREPEGCPIDEGRGFRLRIPSFADPRFQSQAIDLVRGLGDNVHLTIDVRGNNGGDTPCDLVAALMPTCYRFWDILTPDSDSASWTTDDDAFPPMLFHAASWIDPRSDAFRGPITILVDRGTLSAAEDFVAPFKDNGRAWIVGEMTGGSSGQPDVFDFGDGMRLWVSTRRQFLPGGTPFEGIGIPPDVVEPEK